jgi:hypothetical protein
MDGELVREKNGEGVEYFMMLLSLLLLWGHYTKRQKS